VSGDIKNENAGNTDYAGGVYQRGRGARLMSNESDEETTEPPIANDRNYYKVEKWTKDGTKVERMLYAGSNLDKAREVFASAIYHRPLLTIRPD
jgi:hypothetical protein